jgi:WD40 repeat protein
MLAHSTVKVAFDSDSRLVSLAWSRPNASNRRSLEVKRWELERGQMLDVRALPLPVGQGAVSASGHHAALTSLGKLVVVDISEHPIVSIIGERNPSVASLTLAADGSAVAWRSGANSVRIWDAAAKSVTDKTVSGQDLRCLALNPHGNRLAIGGFERVRNTGITRILEPRTGRELAVLRGHINPVSCAEFSPDGRRLATGGTDKSIIVWDLETGKELITLRGHFGTIWTLAFSPDGTRLASGAGDGTVRIWDVRPLE